MRIAVIAVRTLLHRPIILCRLGPTNLPLCSSSITQCRQISTSRRFCGDVYMPQTTTQPYGEVEDIVPLVFSSTLKQKLAASRMNRFQKVFNETRSPFIAQVVETRDVTEVLDLTEKYAETMEVPCVTAAIEILFSFIKDEKTPTRRKELCNSVGMQKLWKVLRRKARHMQSSDIISGIKLLNLLGLPASDTNIQIMLKILTKQANYLELSEIVYLHFLMGKFHGDTKSPLTYALEMALPVVFESQIMTKSQNGELDQESIQLLCDYLHYASDRGLSDKTLKPLVTAIEKNAKSLTPRHAMSILWSLGEAKSDDPYQEHVVKSCFKVVTDNMESYDLNVLSTAMSKANRKYVVKKVPFFYDENFVHSFCNRLMKRHNSNADQALFSLKNVSLFRHVHVEYMDRVGEIIASNPSLVLNNDFLFFSLVKSFCGCNYKPENWHKIEAMLLNHPALSKDLGPLAINLAVDFLALDTYPEVLIQRIFSPQELPNLDAFIQKSPFQISSAHTLLLLLNSVQLLHPHYSGALPPLSMINRWKEITRNEPINRNHSLKAALQTGFGGENYVLNGLHYNGLRIDHVIVMRKGGYPIAMNDTSELKELADIRKPAESDIVLLKVFWKDAYSNNTPRLRGVKALEQRLLEKLGHPMITVDGERWTELADYEKIPFLMHRIREKIDKLQWNQTGSDVIPR
ncbi:uncharacterized protein LOC110859242 [Folsomia candida]|uniref:uncharacterized protein LOC110859242 n=1 Tax=Folsomia candida TaxID=158441 RepID=UPI000B8F8E9A|nr:uncharacterized protein LOC110859242 [Folsomia candida]